MIHIFLASITALMCWWIPKNPSYVLWTGILGFIVFVVITYIFINAKKQNSETHKDYLRVCDENNANIVKIKSLETNVSNIGYNLSSAKLELTGLQKQLSKETSKYQELNDKYENTKREIEHLRQQFDKEQKKAGSLSIELEDEREKISKFAKDIEIEKGKAAQLTKKLEVEIGKQEELKAKYSESQQQLSLLRMQLGKAITLKEEFDSAKSENTSLQQKIEELVSAVVEKDALILERNKTISELVANISEKEYILSEKDSLFAENKSRIGKKDAEIANKDIEITAKNAKIEAKDAELSEKNLIIAENEAKIKALEAKIASSTPNSFNVEDLEKERDLLIEQLESANYERYVKGKELQEQSHLAESRGKEIERITEELRMANDIIIALNEKIIELTALLNAPTSEDSNYTPDDEEQLPPSDTELVQAIGLETVVADLNPEAQEPENQSKKEELVTSIPLEGLRTATPVSKSATTSTTKGKFVLKKHVLPKEEADEDVDLPIIENKTGYVRRSILQVIDVEQEEEELIEADEFFNRSPEEIANVTRMLAEAAESGRETYICACCKTPVKIAKRDFGSREVLFFSHRFHGVACDWQQEHALTLKQDNVLVEGEPYDVMTRYWEIKHLIVDSLTSIKSREMGISDVEADKKICSKYKFMCNRTACVYAKFKDKDLVIELQTKDVLMNTVVAKDVFYRLNGINVIWVFGAEEGGGYDFINKHVPRNIMFANKRNVFMLDKRAIEECDKRKKLVLKCNYLDPDGLWHYRMENHGDNGKFVTLDELSFDEDMCKAYYYDANEDYFNANPDIKKEYYDSIVSKEKLLKDLKATYEGKFAERRKKLSRKNSEALKSPVLNVVVPNIPVVSKPIPSMPILKPAAPIQDMPKAAKPVISVVPVKKEEPVKTFIGYSDRYIYSFEGKKGLVDGQDNFIIPCEYGDILVWTRGKYRVKKIDIWGVIDESRKLIVDIKYKEIGELENGKALVKTATESYYIYENGGRVRDEKIILPNGWTKFRFEKKWGILDSNGKLVVNCVYDEIGSFRGHLVGFRNGKFPTRLSPRYEYRMTISCKCIGNIKNRAHYDINGVELLEFSKKTAVKGNQYHDMFINNISYTKKVIFVSKLSQTKLATKLDHIDADSDFRIGETVQGSIEKIKGNKFYLITADGRKTYFTKSTLTKKGKQVSAYPRGSVLTIKKVAFDCNLERTIWEFVK